MRKCKLTTLQGSAPAKWAWPKNSECGEIFKTYKCNKRIEQTNFRTVEIAWPLACRGLGFVWCGDSEEKLMVMVGLFVEVC